MRIAIVQPRDVYLRGLVAVLTEADLTVVAASTSLAGLGTPPADVVIIDADNAAEPGFNEAVARLAHAVPVLLTTAKNNTSPAFVGVGQFVDRDSSAETLLAAIHAAVSHRAPQPPRTVAERGILSEREYQVLRHIAEGRTQSQIARTLGISHHTVDSYLRRIRAKLDLGNKAELTRAAMLGHLGRGVGSGPPVMPYGRSRV